MASAPLPACKRRDTPPSPHSRRPRRAQLRSPAGPNAATKQPDSRSALTTRGPGCRPSSAAPLGPMHGPGTGAPTVTAALERTPDAKHRRNVVPEPQPRRQAQGRATDGGCAGSRIIRPNSDHPFWAPFFECHRNPMRVPPDLGFRPIQISTFSTTWFWTCECCGGKYLEGGLG